MTAEQFAYWLQGFAELTEGAPSKAQWRSVREHLQTVFEKVTPPVRRVSPTDWSMPGAVIPLSDRAGGVVDTSARLYC